ncbi:hypothetical protein ZWY2020_011988 [Hordeum vulgare]|nr:hypothetical protein ZWY2020_011988 [Hordeum vulgare]
MSKKKGAALADDRGGCGGLWCLHGGESEGAEELRSDSALCFSAHTPNFVSEILVTEVKLTVFFAGETYSHSSRNKSPVRLIIRERFVQMDTAFYSVYDVPIDQLLNVPPDKSDLHRCWEDFGANGGQLVAPHSPSTYDTTLLPERESGWRRKRGPRKRRVLLYAQIAAPAPSFRLRPSSLPRA